MNFYYEGMEQMKKTKGSRFFALLCALMIAGLLAGCGQSLESQLAGSWYRDGLETTQRDGSQGPTFTLYSDGTCKLSNEYGTGTWAVVNEDSLKLTSYYGETDTAKITSLKGGCLTLENGAVFWDSPINEDAG